ncbi:TIGR02186 family protein [Actibacterium ureilyticum]|uniref:TIGR02186 family protein n=1 Tax=Actibacterium ureilyticum TaxID=1590614 RepID=UPI000BAAF38F|nr:TIGR02186 family protein [Actibacterium ureilyticum]
MLWRLCLCLTLLALPLRAEEVVAGLSQARVSITANFAGSEILVFGAIKREAPIDEVPLNVIIAVSGPATPVVVRRKARQFGIWVNSDAVEVDAAPSFYAVASTAPLSQILSNTEDLRHRISTPRAIRAVGVTDTVADTENFTQALMRIRSRQGLYQTDPEAVVLREQTLFRGSIALPANLTEGLYTTRIFLTREGRVIDAYQTAIEVQKVGLERWIFRLAHDHPLIYGLLSLAIAIAAGWGASSFFRYVRS